MPHGATSSSTAVEAPGRRCVVTRPAPAFFVAFHYELRGASGRGCAYRRGAAPACSRVYLCRYAA